MFAFAALRFWDTKEVFFRPVLIMGTALFTGVVVFCYGKIFLLIRRHRQQILRQVPFSMNASISVRATNLKDKAEKKTMTRQKKMYSQNGLHFAFFLSVLFSDICVPSCGGRCQNWRERSVITINLPMCFYTYRVEKFTQPRTLLPSNCRD